MKHATKEQLRTILRQNRRQLSPAEQSRAAHNLAQLIISLPQWARAKHIALYQAADGEIDTVHIAQLARANEKHIYLPVIGTNRSMVFAKWLADTTLQANALGIAEPAPGVETLCAAKLDIVFLPLVGWDKRGGRLGMGGGYYDKTLSGIEGPTLIGLAHQIQEVEKLPTDAWDIPLDLVITDMNIYHCQGR